VRTRAIEFPEQERTGHRLAGGLSCCGARNDELISEIRRNDSQPWWDAEQRGVEDERVTEALSINMRARLSRYAKWAVLVLALAYLVQFALAALHKGQSRMGAAFETIGYEVLRKQYDGLPQMRVVGAGANPSQCSFWNFEWTWGRCVSVVVEVRDYAPVQQDIVEREAKKLGEQLRKPCVLLPSLGIPNEEQLARDLGCGRSEKSFKLRVWVNSVTVVGDQGPPGKPHRWQATNHNHLNSYPFKGEL
jgi:hypothetical protein